MFWHPENQISNLQNFSCFLTETMHIKKKESREQESLFVIQFDL